LSPGIGIDIETTGVIYGGTCELKGDTCSSKDGGAVTAVWAPPDKTQVSVCAWCLVELAHKGIWTLIPGGAGSG
jgi:hypothetical protein